MLIGLKYNVPSRGQLGKNLIWRIYKELDKGHTDTLYVEHVEIIDVETWTGELAYRIGYSLICKGEVSVDYDKENKYKFAVIHGGTYTPAYTEEEVEELVEEQHES